MLIGANGRPADHNADQRPILTPEPAIGQQALPAAGRKGRCCRRCFNDHRQSCDASLRRSRKRATFTMGRQQTRARRQAGFRHDSRLFLRRALVRFASSLAETNRAPANTCIEASLRRAVPSFTVEVRRRPRLATHSSQDLHLSETKTWPAAFENESHRLAARTFGAAKTPNQPSGDGAASYPKRRILPSLVPEKPPGGQPQDAFLSAGASHPMSHAQKPTSAAPIKGKDHISASPRNLEASSELTAQLAERSSAGSARSSASSSDGTAVSLGVPKATANDVVADTGGV